MASQTIHDDQLQVELQKFMFANRSMRLLEIITCALTIGYCAFWWLTHPNSVSMIKINLLLLSSTALIIGTTLFVSSPKTIHLYLNQSDVMDNLDLLRHELKTEIKLRESSLYWYFMPVAVFLLVSTYLGYEYHTGSALPNLWLLAIWAFTLLVLGATYYMNIKASRDQIQSLLTRLEATLTRIYA